MLLKKIFFSAFSFFCCFIHNSAATSHDDNLISTTYIGGRKYNQLIRSNLYASRESEYKARVKELVFEKIKLLQTPTDHEHVAKYCHCRTHVACSKLAKNMKELDYCKKQLQLTQYGFNVLMSDYRQQAQISEMTKNNASQ